LTRKQGCWDETKKKSHISYRKRGDKLTANDKSNYTKDITLPTSGPHCKFNLFKGKRKQNEKRTTQQKKKDTPHYITRKTKSKPVALLQYIFFWSVL